MNDKERPQKKDARARSQGFDEPPPKNDDTAADEEVRVEEFATPRAGDDYQEEASAVATSAYGEAIPANLLEIKKHIEAKLAASAASGAIRSADAYEGSDNVVGVGFGLGEVGPSLGTASLSANVTPGGYALNVYVTELTSVDEIKSVIVDSMGADAASDDSLPLNIIQTGLIQAQPHTFRARPSPCGVSVAHVKVTAGTIGALCVGNSAPRNSRLMVLSNNHVLANSNNAVYGDCIVQPGPYDGGKCPPDQIAILERFVPINFSGGGNVVDCATGWCWPDRVRRELVYRSGGGLQYFRIASAPIAPALGMIVGKSGRTTQLTQGRVTGIGVSVNVNYGGGRVALFVDQIAVQSVNANPFSAGGDSGSSVWAWNTARNPVGLLFAGGGGVTFANRMTRVLAALDVHLYT